MKLLSCNFFKEPEDTLIYNDLNVMIAAKTVVESALVQGRAKHNFNNYENAIINRIFILDNVRIKGTKH